MQKWEYKVIHRRLEQKWIGGPKWSVNMPDVLPDLGNEGWELVTVVPQAISTSGLTEDELWVFKRPVQHGSSEVGE